MAEEVSTSYDTACDVATVEPLFFLYWIEKIEEEDTEHRIQSTEYRAQNIDITQKNYSAP